MIDHKDYTAKALLTEHTPKSIVTDGRLFFGALQIAIASAGLLDMVKKHYVYGKPLNNEKIKELLDSLASHMMTFEEGVFDKVPVEQIIDSHTRELHAAIGLFTESGEALEALFNTYAYGQPFDRVNFIEELGGDISWYQALGLDAVGGDLSDALKKNIAKLQARYRGKFSAEAALNRNATVEREILEGTVKAGQALTTIDAVGTQGCKASIPTQMPPGQVSVADVAEGNAAYHAARGADRRGTLKAHLTLDDIE